MGAVILQVVNGSFAYPKGPEIVKNVDFSLNSGEILAILGPNGAGKTTLLRCITGMLRWKTGTCTLDGADVRSLPQRELWRKMAYVPQARSATLAYSVFQTVLLGRSSRIGSFSSPKQADEQAAQAALERLGIAHLSGKSCGDLSGGEKQMVLIARALAAQPELLIFDEPESNLDFKNQLIVLDTMTELSRQGMACIFNTHYPAHALQRAHKSLLLMKGGEHAYGPTAQVVTEPNIRRAFGVNAVIGGIETRESILPNVVPLSISEDGAEERDNDEAVIASTTVISSNTAAAEQINALLHEYSRLLIGRMGMPHRLSGVNIINITMHGPVSEIDALTHRLSLLPDVSVKTTFARTGGKDTL